MTAPTNKGVVAVNQAGGSIGFKDVDFSKGVEKIVVKIPSTSVNVLSIKLDGVDGTEIGKARLAGNTSGDVDIAVSGNITGTHDIYFVANMAGLTVDSWKAVAPGDTPVTPLPQVINPYDTVQAEWAEGYSHAKLSDNKKAVVIEDGGYILVSNISFSKGLSGFNVYASAAAPKIKLNIYVDTNPTPIGSIEVGNDITAPRAIKLTSDITGKHFLYFEAKGGTLTLDSWSAMGAGQTPPVDPPVYGDINPYNTVEAENAADINTGMLTPSKNAVLLNAGGYAVYKNVDLSKGLSKFLITAGSTAPSSIEVRMGSATGTKLASTLVSGSAAERTATYSGSGVTGKKDIYIVNTGNGSVTIDSWKAVEKGQTPVDPPVDPPVVQSGLDLSYTTSTWNGGFQMNIKVTNKSGKSVSSWKVKIKKSDVNITQSWCVNLRQEGDYYVITPMDYNSSLSNGQTVEFGIIGSGTPSNTLNYTVE